MHDAAEIDHRLRPGDQSPVTLVVFDCDGVLIDSEILVCRLTAEELTRLGYPIGTEEVIERFGFIGGSHCRTGHRERLLQAGAEQVFAEFDELEALAPSAFQSL